MLHSLGSGKRTISRSISIKIIAYIVTTEPSPCYIWRMMKAQEDLASAVKEIGLQLKENAAIREQGKEEL